MNLFFKRATEKPMALLAAIAAASIAAHSFHPFRAYAAEDKTHATWREYGGSADSSHYSSLTQINKSNVAKLQLAWFYPAGDNGLLFGSNPSIIGSTMYVIGKNNSIVALDAATGKEIWVHDTGNPRFITHRGLNYWENSDKKDRRLFYSTGHMLHAINAQTGQPIGSFGNNGTVDLRNGLGRDPATIRQIESGTPGRVFENLLILGSATGEEYGSPPGDLRAFDVVTGKLVWTFHTIPHPGEPGYDTWPVDAWKTAGGVNTWADFSLDERRGIVYFPLGAPTYDFYGADRPGTNLYGDCLLALDARTGKYLWHFQAVHHDLWDYDLSSSPQLLTIRHEGKPLDVVAQPDKNGFVYVFDRVTGTPIWPINERSVPKSDVPGEQAWPTQPFPSAPPPFVRQTFRAEDVDPYIADPAEREKIRKEIASARNEGLFTPPGTTDTIEMPGNGGGANWGGSASDPASGFLYIQAKNAPSMLKLEPKQPKRNIPGSPETKGRILYIQNCQMCHRSELQGQPPSIPSLIDVVKRVGADRIRNAVTNGAPPMPAFPDLDSKDIDSLIAYLSNPSEAKVSPELMALLKAPPLKPADGAAPARYWTGYGYMDSSDGLPAVKPPWSTLTAYDLNKGTIAWQVPLGEVARLAAKGIKDTGSYWPRGGVAVTAGGVIFAGTKSDSKLRAYDKDTGRVLWEMNVPAAPEGIPAVYEVGGKEYVVVSARPGAVLAGTEAGSRANSEQPSEAGSRDAKAHDAEKPEVQGYYVYALPNAASR